MARHRRHAVRELSRQSHSRWPCWERLFIRQVFVWFQHDRSTGQLHRGLDLAGRRAPARQWCSCGAALPTATRFHALASGSERARHHDRGLRAHRRPAAGHVLDLGPWDTLLISVVLYIIVAGDPGAALAAASAQARTGAFERAMQKDRAVVDGRAAADVGSVRLPGRGHHPAAVSDRHASRADLDSSVLQFGLAYWLNKRAGSTLSPVLRPDRCQQLLRAGRGGRHPAISLHSGAALATSLVGV